MKFTEKDHHIKELYYGVEKGSEEPLKETEVKELCVGYGIGSSKKEGQQNAAKMALILYGFLNKDQYENSDILSDWKNTII